MARILIAGNYDFTDIQRQWMASCPNLCWERHEFQFNASGTFDLVCVVNWPRKPVFVKAPRNQFLKLVQEPSWKGRFSHRFVEKHSSIFRKVRGHQDAVKGLGAKAEEGYSFVPHQVPPSSYSSKTELVSIIASTQSQLPGQAVRNQVVNHLLQSMPRLTPHTFGRGRREVLSKTEALDAYMFTLAVENSSIRSYFTEKVTDPILRNCVPIYFGARNLSEYLPKDSFIELTELSAEAVEAALANLSAEDYESRLGALREAQSQLTKHLRICCWLSREVRHEPTEFVSRILGVGLEEMLYRGRIALGRMMRR